MPTKFRLPNFIPLVKTKVVELTGRNKSEITSIFNDDDTEPDTTSNSVETTHTPEPAAIKERDFSIEPTKVEVAYKGGHHEQAQESEISFNHRLSALERFAVESAQAHAAAGLPRINVDVTDELPVETQLRARAAELFIDWKSRSVRKTQDALQRAVLDAGCGVVELRHAIDQARLTQFKVAKVQEDLATAKAESIGEASSISFDRHLPLWAYIVVVGILLVVEWVANVAVFRALLPIDADADRTLRALTQDSSGTWLSGLQHLAAKFAVSPEAGILAIGTIVLLMFLAHAVGAAARRYLVAQQKGRAEVKTRMIAEARQAKTTFWTSLAGVITLLIFLIVVRYQIGKIADTQYKDAHNQTQSLQQKYDDLIAADKIDEANGVNQQRALAARSEQARLENRDYARSISSINVTIIFLNIGLVIVATLAAYQESHGTLTEDRIVDPAVAAFEIEVDRLYNELMSHRHKARTLDLEIQTHIARARYLSKASPTADWEAKIERLNAVIPLFRTTNAQVRGIDAQNIMAFQTFRTLAIAAPEANVLQLPAELAECDAEFKRLKQQLDFLRSDLLPDQASEAHS